MLDLKIQGPLEVPADPFYSMSQHSTIFIPMFQRGWHTRAVLEGLTQKFHPTSIHIASLPDQINALDSQVSNWNCAPVHFYDENYFFDAEINSKSSLCKKIESLPTLYQAGWFYQQLLKLGCQETIPQLTDWTLVWDSDLIPLTGWPSTLEGVPATALLQHKSKGNPKIVASWRSWIEDHLEVKPVEDSVATFIPHHMWFYRPAILELLNCFRSRSQSGWQTAILETLNTHSSFSEFWSVASWMAAKFPSKFAYHPYDLAGSSTERFFDDGRGKLSNYFKNWLSEQGISNDPYPSYKNLLMCMDYAYNSSQDSIPSSLSLEANVRHIDKLEENRHLEEVRSRWLVRDCDRESLGV